MTMSLARPVSLSSKFGRPLYDKKFAGFLSFSAISATHVEAIFQRCDRVLSVSRWQDIVNRQERMVVFPREGAASRLNVSNQTVDLSEAA